MKDKKLVVAKLEHESIFYSFKDHAEDIGLTLAQCRSALVQY